MAGRALTRNTRFAGLVGGALRATDVGSPGAFAERLQAPASPKQLWRLARQNAGASKALGEGGLAFEIARRQVLFTAALGEPILIVNEKCLVDRDTTLTPLRCAARFDDPAGFAFSTGAVRGGDLDPLRRRLCFLAPGHPYAHQRDPAE
jgi:hypothetical protein